MLLDETINLEALVDPDMFHQSCIKETIDLVAALPSLRLSMDASLEQP